MLYCQTLLLYYDFVSIQKEQFLSLVLELYILLLWRGMQTNVLYSV